jgi:hypothetical protein
MQYDKMPLCIWSDSHIRTWFDWYVHYNWTVYVIHVCYDGDVPDPLRPITGKINGGNSIKILC